MLLKSLLGRHARAQRSARNRSRCRRSSFLAAEQLEPRTLLAVTTFSTPTRISPPDNLLQNGSFEANQLASKRTWDTFKPGQLTGWTIVAPEGVMAEVQREGLKNWNGTHGKQWLELDGDETGPGVGWDTKVKGRSERGLYAIEQLVQVTANVPFVLRFDYAGRPGRSTGDNQMGYTVVDAGGETIFSGTITAPHSFSDRPVWRTATTIFTPTTDGALLVRFEGKGDDNTFGMLLDNTVLVKASVDPHIVDLDIDSNNDNRLLAPDRSSIEEAMERTVGKQIVINDNDTDGDGVPDYADGFGYGDLPTTKQGIAGKRFTPIILQIPDYLPLEAMRVTFSYASSAPDTMKANFELPNDGGLIRLWTANADVLRSPKGVTAGDEAGHFIPNAIEIQDLTKLGYTDTLRTQVFYVEGVRLSEGQLVPIIVHVTAAEDGELLGEQLVNVIVVSNTIVIGVDGTDSEAWLSKVVNGVRINERNIPGEGTRWNSHVRNLVADSERKAMTIYRHGSADLVRGSDSGAIFQDVLGTARDMIKDAGGGTTIAIVGWSRGAMIGSGVANALLTLEAGDLPRTVAFVGMYDPVDMSDWIPPAWAVVHPDVKAVTIVGPTGGNPSDETFNVDFPVGDQFALNDPIFVRMALLGRISVTGAATVEQRTFYNGSHGALGGTPGFNRLHLDGSDYDYALDRRNSIQADKDVRNGMRAAGLGFVPVRNDDWYGFPDERPPVEYRG
jgi:hypothetical protein